MTQLAELITGVARGDDRALAHALSTIEDRAGGAEELIDALAILGRALPVIGVTGAPGVGKSSLVNQIVGRFRADNKRVAVLAVDPSSPVTGGALLGDRIRLQDHAGDSGVFIRSLSARGHLGGLVDSTADLLTVLRAAPFDVIVLETVGVGQSEIEVMKFADTVVVVTAPGLGDSVQAAKAGILEIASVIVVNKSDLDGADRAVGELERAELDAPVVATCALTGAGLVELMALLR